jgi:hypothetical protein
VPIVGAAPGPALEHDLSLHDHEADEPARGVGKALEPVAEAVVGDDRCLELAREREDEVVGIGAGGRLTDLAVVDHPLVACAVVDLVPERRVDDHHRLVPLLAELLAHGDDVGEEGLLPLARVGDVGAVHEHDGSGARGGR